MSGSYKKLACDAYRQAAKFPGLVSAELESATGDLITLSSVWSQTNLATYKKENFTRVFGLSSQTLGHVFETLPAPQTGISLSTTRNGIRCLVRAGVKVPEEQTIEVWEGTGQKLSFNLKDIDVHGAVYTDNEFGSLDLAPNAQSLLYVAEKKKEKTLPFLHQGPVAEGVNVGGEYNFREEWGEQLVGKSESVIAIIDLQTEQPASIKIMEGVPANWAPGLVRWWVGGVVGVAYRTTPRRLGKVYCSNRPSVLFHLSEAGVWTELTSTAGNPDYGIEAIEISPQGRLVWFERTLSQSLYPGPHRAAVRIMARDSLAAENRQIFSESQPGYDGTVGRCCGIFSPVLSSRCWVDDDKFLLSCPQGETTVPILVDTAAAGAGACSVFTHATARGVTVLDVNSGYIVGNRSDPTTPPHLVIAKIPSADHGSSTVFSPVNSGTPAIPGLTTHQFFIPNPPVIEGGASLPYTAFYVGSGGSDGVPVNSAPLIVWPHGGPHGVITTTFMNVVIYFCKLGFNILFVNYRGSLGFSEENVNSLPGHVGDMDVKDCDYARELCLSTFPHLSPEKVFLMGGSHGGFLVTHLAGQYPDNYKGVVARNPVTNIASILSGTDIPDWGWVESGLAFTWNCKQAGIEYNWKNSEPAVYQEMWSRSPIAHVDNVKAPIFLLVGENDLRVPPSQGYEYYYALKGRGKTVKMHIYDDNHPLGKPENDANVMISAAIFFNDIMAGTLKTE